MSTFLVAVGVTRCSFTGQRETMSRAFRIRATDAIAAGEQAIDRMVSGSNWSYSAAHARVIAEDTREVVADVKVQQVKSFGLPRNRTRELWRTPMAAAV